MMSPEELIKEKALALGARAAGIASAEDIGRLAPEGHRPGDLLKGAESVIVLGGNEPTLGAWKSSTNRVLGSIGYNRSLLASAARKLAYYVEEEHGRFAIPVPSGLWIGHYPYISLKLCAEMAGLGTRSMAAGIILNHSYGLLYYNAVVTTMPLQKDGPLEKPVCPSEACLRLWEKRRTTPCLASCPDCLSGELRDGKIGWMEYDQDLCYTRAQTTAMDTFQKLLLAALDEPDPWKRKAIVLGSGFSRAVRSLAYSNELSAQCFNCLKRCPIILRLLKRCD